MSKFRIFPSLIPEGRTYATNELMDDVTARTLQGIAAAHETDDVNGQSSAWQIADYLTANHYQQEIDAMIFAVQQGEPPYAEIDLSECINDRSDITQYNG